MFRFYERQIGNLTTEGAQAMGAAEQLAIQLKKAQERIADLERKYEAVDNVVPMKDPA